MDNPVAQYDFKWLPELLWAVGTAVVIFVLTSILGTTDETDWESWAISVGGGALRAAAAAALNVVRKVAV